MPDGRPRACHELGPSRAPHAFPRAVRPASLAFAALAATLTLAAGAFPGPAPTARQRAATRRGSAALGPAALRFGRSVGLADRGAPPRRHAPRRDATYLRIVPADTRGRRPLGPRAARHDARPRRARRCAASSRTRSLRSGTSRARAAATSTSTARTRAAATRTSASSCAARRAGSSCPRTSCRSAATARRPAGPGAYFDDAKNWALVAALVDDPEAHVTHLFVAAPLRARLLAYAERIGAPHEHPHARGGGDAAAPRRAPPRRPLPRAHRLPGAHERLRREPDARAVARTAPPTRSRSRRPRPRWSHARAPRRATPTAHRGPEAAPTAPAPEPAPPAEPAAPVDDVAADSSRARRPAARPRRCARRSTTSTAERRGQRRRGCWRGAPSLRFRGALGSKERA